MAVSTQERWNEHNETGRRHFERAEFAEAEQAYIAALKVEFPVALADPSVMTPQGPFGELAAVPTVVVLDREGKIVWKHTGLAKADELRGHMARL